MPDKMSTKITAQWSTLRDFLPFLTQMIRCMNQSLGFLLVYLETDIVSFRALHW